MTDIRTQVVTYRRVRVEFEEQDARHVARILGEYADRLGHDGPSRARAVSDAIYEALAVIPNEEAAPEIGR